MSKDQGGLGGGGGAKVEVVSVERSEAGGKRAISQAEIKKGLADISYRVQPEWAMLKSGRYNSHHHEALCQDVNDLFNRITEDQLSGISLEQVQFVFKLVMSSYIAPGYTQVICVNAKVVSCLVEKFKPPYFDMFKEQYKHFKFTPDVCAAIGWEGYNNEFFHGLIEVLQNHLNSSNICPQVVNAAGAKLELHDEVSQLLLHYYNMVLFGKVPITEKNVEFAIEKIASPMQKEVGIRELKILGRLRIYRHCNFTKDGFGLSASVLNYTEMVRKILDIDLSSCSLKECFERVLFQLMCASRGDDDFRMRPRKLTEYPEGLVGLKAYLLGNLYPDLAIMERYAWKLVVKGIVELRLTVPQDEAGIFSQGDQLFHAVSVCYDENLFKSTLTALPEYMACYKMHAEFLVGLVSCDMREVQDFLPWLNRFFGYDLHNGVDMLNQAIFIYKKLLDVIPGLCDEIKSVKKQKLRQDAHRLLLIFEELQRELGKLLKKSEGKLNRVVKNKGRKARRKARMKKKKQQEKQDKLAGGGGGGAKVEVVAVERNEAGGGGTKEVNGDTAAAVSPVIQDPADERSDANVPFLFHYDPAVAVLAFTIWDSGHSHFAECSAAGGHWFYRFMVELVQQCKQAGMALYQKGYDVSSMGDIDLIVKADGVETNLHQLQESVGSVLAELAIKHNIACSFGQDEGSMQNCRQVELRQLETGDVFQLDVQYQLENERLMGRSFESTSLHAAVKELSFDDADRLCVSGPIYAAPEQIERLDAGDQIWIFTGFIQSCLSAPKYFRNIVFLLTAMAKLQIYFSEMPMLFELGMNHLIEEESPMVFVERTVQFLVKKPYRLIAVGHILQSYIAMFESTPVTFSGFESLRKQLNFCLVMRHAVYCAQDGNGEILHQNVQSLLDLFPRDRISHSDALLRAGIAF